MMDSDDIIRTELKPEIELFASIFGYIPATVEVLAFRDKLWADPTPEELEELEKSDEG
jgi:hypothetical protein